MHRLRVEDSSQVGEARRLAASMAREFGLDDIRVEHVSIVVTELATNLINHAGGGDILLRVFRDSGISGIEVLSLDKGPGIGNIGRSLGDGYSNKGSQGNGLGAIQRLSTVFDIYSKPGLGTAVLSIIRQQSLQSAAHTHLLEIGAVCLPVATEESCGDAWSLYQSPDRVLIMIADGLGHGKFAAEASAAAAEIFEHHTGDSPKQLIERMHAALRSTRGAGVSVTEVAWGRHMVHNAGVGNISGRIDSGEGFRNMVSHNGTVGMEARKIEEFAYPWPEDGLLIMHSDGVDTHWNLDDYPGLRGRNSALIAGVLFRDHNRVRDDNTIIVMRETRSRV